MFRSFHQRTGRRSGAKPGNLSPRAVRLLRQSNAALLARATHGAPSHLRAFAARLIVARDELRFRLPAFATYLDAVAAIAEAEALRRDSARALRLTADMRSGGRLRWPLHGRAKFSQR